MNNEKFTITKVISVSNPDTLETELQKLCDKYVQCDIEIQYRPISYDSNKFKYLTLFIARWNGN